ncbi:GtrA family protein [Bordetella avium]|nr:polysaccharide biosynthesis protein GtrA [Bordetella avium]AZY54233.1 polysaccharide biosynthesis protein GtrA [Bordetella avium]RIQ14315.1 GtrA family protein [Bordetella avium]RIQ18175.1 GtrA family protein [Bordetella avium]RIQ36666.1 GtrA family protein [Bordetella avium]
MAYLSAFKAVWCDTRLLKFLMVGMLNTAVGYSIFLLGLYIGWHYSIAIAVATVLGTLFNFKSTGVLVFRSHDNSRIFRFIAVYCVIYSLNVAGVALLLQFGLKEWSAGLLLLLPLALVSYYLNSRYVFPS